MHSNSLNHQITNSPNFPIFTLAIGNRATQAKQAITDIANNKNNTINPDLFKLYNDNYSKAINSVFGDIDSEHPLWEKVQQFKLNTADFAAHKSYKATQELVNAKGKDYDASAKQIVGKYNRYQSAEYNTIISRSRTAKQWDTFQGEKHLYPNLEWIRTSSSTPRELHIAFVGIILPINDPFWQENQPGNLWNCKCDWKTTDADTTPEPDKIVPAQDGLKGNPYETGKLISDDHPYFKNIPKDDEKEVDYFLMQQIRDDNTKIVKKTLQNNKINFEFEGKDHPLIFSGRGINHVFHNTHKYQNLKNMSIPYIPEILKTAELADQVIAEKNDENIKRYLYFKYDILDKPAYINIKELENGDMKVYAITPSILK